MESGLVQRLYLDQYPLAACSLLSRLWLRQAWVDNSDLLDVYQQLQGHPLWTQSETGLPKCSLFFPRIRMYLTLLLEGGDTWRLGALGLNITPKGFLGFILQPLRQDVIYILVPWFLKYVICVMVVTFVSLPSTFTGFFLMIFQFLPPIVDSLFLPASGLQVSAEPWLVSASSRKFRRHKLFQHFGQMVLNGLPLLIHWPTTGISADS